MAFMCYRSAIYGLTFAFFVFWLVETGATTCGTGQCLNDTVCCPGEKECCNSLDLCCGEHCCRRGYECCHGSPRCCKSSSSCCGELCCPENSRCCPNKKHCCPAGFACCDDTNGCCPINSQCCGKYCCAENTKCCPNGTGCYTDGFKCCGNGLACPESSSCCGRKCCGKEQKCCGLQCCPLDTKCCAGGCCTSGSTVVTVSVSSIFSQSALTKDKTYSNPTKSPDTNTVDKSAKPVDLSTDMTYLVFPIMAVVGIAVVLVACCIVIKRSSGSDGLRAKVREYTEKMKEMVIKKC